MGKEVNHPHRKLHKHREHHEKTQPSKLSLFKHRVADLFKEIVEDVPEDTKSVELSEEVTGGIRITAETNELPEKEKVGEKEILETAEIEELSADELKQQEREEMRQRIHEHIVTNLNSAVARWKETGEIGIHLEPPVPLKEKVKSFLSKVKAKSSPVASKLKSRVEEVAEKVAARVKQAKKSGEQLDEDVVVKEEWTKVLQKLDSMGSAAERDEIEKIYKQLSGDE
ncbi:MAG: hypothetical protein QW165_03515 [Candidatus Woesearchaeota archaeon]